jgi:hypothetical protein
MGDRKRSWSASRRRSADDAFDDRVGGPVVALLTGDLTAVPELFERRRKAMPFLETALARAEEMYLVDPDATLGTWFARVTETVAVASRVILKWIAEGHSLAEKEVVQEQIGLFADICAEAIRAASRAQGKERSGQARGEILEAVFVSPAAVMDSSWSARLSVLASCTAALERLANGLREGDLPMDEPTDCDQVEGVFRAVAILALHVVEAHL